MKTKNAPTTGTTKKTPAAQAANPVKTRLRKNVVLETADMIEVTFSVPGSIARMIGREGRYAFIPSARVFRDLSDHVSGRVKQWHPTNKKERSRSEYSADLMAQKCDSEITAIFRADEWVLMEEVCRRLGISMRDWLLGAAGYNAEMEPKRRKVA